MSTTTKNTKTKRVTIQLTPVCYRLGRLGDGSFILVTPFRKYDPSKGWLLTIEYPFSGQYSRVGFLGHDGQLVRGGRRLKSLIFTSADEAATFFRTWVAKKRVTLDSLNLVGFEQAASSDFNSDLLAHPPVKADREFMQRQPGWSIAFFGDQEKAILQGEGKTVVQLWQDVVGDRGPHFLVAIFSDGSWQHVAAERWDQEYQRKAGGRSAKDLEAYWQRARLSSES